MQLGERFRGQPIDDLLAAGDLRQHCELLGVQPQLVRRVPNRRALLGRRAQRGPRALSWRLGARRAHRLQGRLTSNGLARIECWWAARPH
jgi:hypothetical protein